MMAIAPEYILLSFDSLYFKNSTFNSRKIKSPKHKNPTIPVVAKIKIKLFDGAFDALDTASFRVNSV